MSTSASGSPNGGARWIRQAHRWVSVAFTLAILANVVALLAGRQEVWIGFAALPPLALLLISGIYLFVLPYLERRTRGDGR